jgi:SpoVK/Ycf46/Vps4 family AAA+-type ATPase
MSKDPTRINNYNKFLSTLDSNINLSIEKEIINLLTSKLDININKNNQINTDKEERQNVDKVVKEINEKFNKNNYCSENFSGNKLTDECCKDPNYYRDIKNKKINKKLILYISPGSIMPLNKIKNPDKLKKNEERMNEEKRNEEKVEIKETITIEEEINSISDLLCIINKYKYESSIKYNINMKALHDIKEPLTELNNMIGLHSLKTNVVDQILYFAQDLHKNASISSSTSGDFMHTVIYGPPGTGKTEAAKIMGKIYSKLGVLKKGTFKKVTRSDLIAGYLGQTALKTQEVIKEALGGVLFIDEAYALGSSEKRDSFAKECIDTLCEALSDNKDNLMVIVAGYEKELKDCFFSFNQGLDSRFTWRFKTDDYSAEDLYNIFIKKVKDIDWDLDTTGIKINVDWFKKNKGYFKFYGRDIETLLSKCKIAHSKRVFCLPETEKRKLNLKDLEKGFEIYLKNEEVKSRNEENEIKKQLYNSLYS